MTSVLIADDEPALSRRLARLLRESWDEQALGPLELLEAAVDGPTALASCQKLEPAIAFLDIRMPGASGLDVAAQLQQGSTKAPLVVFVTAYDEYALPAFEAAAVDYLVKPVNRDRLQSCLARLADRLKQPDAQAPAQLAAALAQLQASLAAPPKERLRWLRAGRGEAVELVAVDDVIYFRAEHKYTTVVTRTGEHILRLSLKELSEQLDPDSFWQVHRSVIVKVAEIEQAERDLRGRYRLKLRGRTETLRVSQTYTHLFKQM